jgi:hypothetical protein
MLPQAVGAEAEPDHVVLVEMAVAPDLLPLMSVLMLRPTLELVAVEALLAPPALLVVMVAQDISVLFTNARCHC